MDKLKLYKVIKLDLKILIFSVLIFIFVLITIVNVSASSVENGETKIDEVAIPIVMYHSVTTNYNKLGEYIIADYEFESDLRYLETHGYEAVFIEDLINYTKGGTLPEKPIILSFDDGYFDNYSSALNIAMEHGYKMVIAVIGSVAEDYEENGDENPNYAHLSWSRLNEMVDTGYVEIQCHTYDMHKTEPRKGVKKKWGESEEEYEFALTNDLNRFIGVMEENMGSRPTAIAYPFGAYGDTTGDIIKKAGFQAIMTSTEKVSTISRNKSSLYGLGRYVRPSGFSSEDFFKNHMGLEG